MNESDQLDVYESILWSSDVILDMTDEQRLYELTYEYYQYELELDTNESNSNL